MGMTRETAERIVKGITDKIEANTADMNDWAEFWGFTVDEYEEFLDMAVKALEQQSEDVISRQAAIDIVQYECGEWKGLAKEIVKQFNGLPSIQPKQIECEDAISREDALKALAYDIESFEFKSGVSRHMNEIANLLNAIYEIQSDNIKALPSVQPKTGHWISVNERLPEIRQNVLCQCRGNIYSILRLNHNGDWECIYPHTTYMQSFVTAWMSLPEPYKPQESEDKE